MDKIIYEDEIFEIEELQQEFYEEDEIIEISPFETKALNNNEDIGSNKAIKRLTCNVLGCGYQTDRRWDLRRHWNSLKHENDEVPYESDSDIQRSVFTCNLCNYKTAKKFSFDRHKKSTKHRRKKMAEKLESPSDTAEADHLKKSETDKSPYICNICKYRTQNKFCYVRHIESRKHRLQMQKEKTAIDDEIIEYSYTEHDLQQDKDDDEDLIICHKEVIEQEPTIDDLIYVDEEALQTSEEIIYMPSSTIITSKEHDTIEETRYYMVLNNV